MDDFPGAGPIRIVRQGAAARPAVLDWDRLVPVCGKQVLTQSEQRTRRVKQRISATKSGSAPCGQCSLRNSACPLLTLRQNLLSAHRHEPVPIKDSRPRRRTLPDNPDRSGPRKIVHFTASACTKQDSCGLPSQAMT
jgi:hypothetical protein